MHVIFDDNLNCMPTTLNKVLNNGSLNSFPTKLILSWKVLKNIAFSQICNTF